MLTENYIYDALQAEREGEQFPIEYLTIRDSLGYSTWRIANQYIKRNAEKLILLGLCNSGIQLKPDSNHSVDFNKLCLSVKGFKFALAKADTEKGIEYPSHS
jgi:hypothetical protein